VNHFATPEFWLHYRRLPLDVRQLADRCFQLLRNNPGHPSLHLKKVGIFWSARVGLRYRALAKQRNEGLVLPAWRYSPFAADCPSRYNQPVCRLH
jgi:hypothetical protein